MAAPAPLLNLDTIVHAPVVTINGQRYPLKPRAMKSIVEVAKLQTHGQLIEAIAPKIGTPALTVDEATSLARALDEVCRAALDAPAAIHDKLDDFQRLRICEVFIELQTPSRPGTGAATTPATTRKTKTSIGARSSRRSSASTAATRGNG